MKLFTAAILVGVSSLGALAAHAGNNRLVCKNAEESFTIDLNRERVEQSDVYTELEVLEFKKRFGRNAYDIEVDAGFAVYTMEIRSSESNLLGTRTFMNLTVRDWPGTRVLAKKHLKCSFLPSRK